MKKITIILTMFLFVLTTLAQNQINWVTTIELEESLENSEKNYFIYIENDDLFDIMDEEEEKEWKKKESLLLKDNE